MIHTQMSPEFEHAYVQAWLKMRDEAMEEWFQRIPGQRADLVPDIDQLIRAARNFAACAQIEEFDSTMVQLADHLENVINVELHGNPS